MGFFSDLFLVGEWGEFDSCVEEIEEQFVVSCLVFVSYVLKMRIEISQNNGCS